MQAKPSYKDRAAHCKHPITKKLLQLMEQKQTNLALSADVTTAKELLHFADLIGPEICVLKTHIDIISDFTPDLITQLRRLADQHQFLLFEDRKFADIGHTVKHQFSGGIYKIADWADIINAHSLPGPGIVKGLLEALSKKECGLLLLAEMSSAGHLMDEEYQQQTVKLAEQFPDFVIGFIAQHKLTPHPHLIHMTPGVKLQRSSDNLDQQYVDPETAIQQHETDIIIVGRGILTTRDPLAEAKKYRQRGWKAYAG